MSFHMCQSSFQATLGSLRMSRSSGTGMSGGSVAAALRCASVSSRDGRMCRLPLSSAGIKVPMKHSGRALGRNRLAGALASASVAALAPSAFSLAASPCSGSARAQATTASA